MDAVLPSAPRVVVGVDDSAASRWALVWAIGEACLRRMPLLVVHVSRAPVHPIPEVLPYVHESRLEEARSIELIASLFDDVAGGIPDELQVVSLARLGEPWQHLVELARQGDLLVLGRGRHGWVSRVLLASTRRCCIRYAQTTLVIVAPPVAPDQPASSAKRAGERLRLGQLWLRARLWRHSDARYPSPE